MEEASQRAVDLLNRFHSASVSKQSGTLETGMARARSVARWRCAPSATAKSMRPFCTRIRVSPVCVYCERGPLYWIERWDGYRMPTLDTL
jgi:hypothetical protein